MRQAGAEPELVILPRSDGGTLQNGQFGWLGVALLQAGGIDIHPWRFRPITQIGVR